MKDNQVRITSIIEKPKEPKSNYAVTGYYIFDNSVFDRISWLNYSDRGELEVTDLNMSYLNDNKIKTPSSLKRKNPNSKMRYNEQCPVTQLRKND